MILRFRRKRKRSYSRLARKGYPTSIIPYLTGHRCETTVAGGAAFVLFHNGNARIPIELDAVGSFSIQWLGILGGTV